MDPIPIELLLHHEPERPFKSELVWQLQHMRHRRQRREHSEEQVHAKENSHELDHTPAGDRPCTMPGSERLRDSAYRHRFEAGQVGGAFVPPQTLPPARHLLDEVESLGRNEDNVVVGVLASIERVTARSADGDLALIRALEGLPELDEFQIGQD